MSRTALIDRVISPPTERGVTRVVASIAGTLAVTRISIPSSRLAFRTCLTSAACTAVAATNTQLAPVSRISSRSSPMGPSTGREPPEAGCAEVATKPSGR